MAVVRHDDKSIEEKWVHKLSSVEHLNGFPGIGWIFENRFSVFRHRCDETGTPLKQMMVIQHGFIIADWQAGGLPQGKSF